MDASRDRLPSVMPRVRDALTEDIQWSWPGAGIRHDSPLSDGHVFWIRAHSKDYRLELGHRAKWHAEARGDAHRLMDALRARRWIEVLLEHGYGFVTMVEDDYVLRVPGPERRCRPRSGAGDPPRTPGRATAPPPPTPGTDAFPQSGRLSRES